MSHAKVRGIAHDRNPTNVVAIRHPSRRPKLTWADDAPQNSRSFMRCRSGKAGWGTKMRKSNVVPPKLRESSLDRSNKVASLRVDDIDVKTNPLRPLDEEKVKLIAASMARLGLMTSITVRYHEERPDFLPADGSTDSYELIAGRHRLAAAKSLGWDWIDVDEIKCSDIEARLWEIAENLHRAELTQLQRDEQVAEWIRLTDEGVSSQLAKKPQGGRPESGINAAAREIGVGKDDAHRAVKVASLSDEAKAAAVKHGLDDNRSVLLEAAKETEPKAQVDKIVARAEKPKSKPAPIDEEPDDTPAIERAAEFFVEADVPGSAATNKLIEKVVGFWESIDPLFTAWLEKNPGEEATRAMLDAVSHFADDLQHRAWEHIKKQRRVDNKIDRAYSKHFGYCLGPQDREVYRLMEASLLSGIDELAETKARREREYKESAERREREHEEFLRTPIDAETECRYTAMIKQRTLYEGACELSWQQYFKYRDQHPDCTPLSQDDLAYAGMWTACAVQPTPRSTA
jgi:ParB-like chromosome segregation protein Spo0J